MKKEIILPISADDYLSFLNNLSDNGVCIMSFIKKYGMDEYIKMINKEYREWLKNNK